VQADLNHTKAAETYTDDGLYMPEVGAWAADKHRKVGYYAKVFSESIKQKWDCRVFIDLFAGSGLAKLKRTGEIVPGSPMVSLGLACPFDRYLFCEMNPDAAAALKTRIDTHFPDRNALVLNCDSNNDIQRVLNSLPAFGRTFTGLSCCFVDPFNANNLRFETISRIARTIRVDFVVLLPTFMDIKRNLHNYTKNDCPTLDLFLGDRDWRPIWEARSNPNRDFGVFIADQFGLRMKSLGYLYETVEDFETVRRGEDWSLYLYHLGFFSKNKLGVKFWRDTKKNTNQQTHFGF
jgi:three-Cys-motif partner protein